MYASAYTPLASPITTVGANSAAALPARSGMMSGPRRIGGTGSGWDNWLKSLDDKGGYLYSDEDGNRYYDMDLLQKAFEDAQKNSQFPGMTWEQFLDEFFDPSGRHNVPVGEPWILLLFVALLVVIQRRRLAKNACA
jgi:hypothetical protein